MKFLTDTLGKAEAGKAEASNGLARRQSITSTLQGLVIAGVLTALGLAVQAQDTQPIDGKLDPPAEDADKNTAQPYKEAEVATARMAQPGLPGHRNVRSVRVLVDGGGRMDWSQQGDWIAFDRVDSSGFYHLYKMRPDGTRETCITCDQWDFRKTNSLSPAWHPSGEHLVFQVQDNANKLKLDTLRLTTPHRGLHSEIWIISADGKNPFKLTQTRDRGAAVLDPHFSHEASMLVWTQRVVSLGRWGEWEPHVAEFKIRRGVPRISKVKNYQPGLRKGYVVAHGFTPNDRGLLISGIPANSGSRDILELDLETGSTEPLTTSPRELDELVFALPRADGVVWVSNRNIDRPSDRVLPRQVDVWYMSASKRRQERLTFFNDPQSDHYLGEALIDDLAWSPDGDKLLVHVVKGGVPGTDSIEEAIYIVEFDGVFGT